MPTESGRSELFKIYLRGVKLSNDIDWEYLVKNSDGYSGADISNVLIYFIFILLFCFFLLGLQRSRFNANEEKTDSRRWI